MKRTSGSQLDLAGTGYCASFNFRRTARAVTRLYDSALQQAGIRSTQFTILVAIAKTQPTSIGSLADLLVMDRSTLTRSLRLVQRQGLLIISKRSTMRQRFVTLTAKGEKVLERSLPYWREVHQRFTQLVGAEYWVNLRGELERLSGVVASMEKSESRPGTD